MLLCALLFGGSEPFARNPGDGATAAVDDDTIRATAAADDDTI